MKWKIVKQCWSVVALFILGALLFFERRGVQCENTELKKGDEVLVKAQQSEFSEAVKSIDTDCLVLVNSDVEVSGILAENMYDVLDEMKLSYDSCDLANKNLIDISKYKKIVITFTNLGILEENVDIISQWVYNGGNLMNMSTYETNGYFENFSDEMGIEDTSNDYCEIKGVKFSDDFMIGSKDKEFSYGDSQNSGVAVRLVDDAIVYAKEIQSDMPLIWEKSYGKGKFVVTNQDIYGKDCRGIICATYSLMGSTCIYPVINASSFYIDDFPAPIPLGDSHYVTDDYGVDISTFYLNIWWPNILNWEKEYGIVHTGVVIEDYSDIIKAPFVRNSDTHRFMLFGNMLLNNGGEIGFHGYNHMPLCKKGFDYQGLYDSYNLWKNDNDIAGSLIELYNFTKDLFPNETFSVYVPPSNIISDEGIKVLKETLPDVTAIASSYLPGDVGYVQEYEVTDNGMVQTPRIVSGCQEDPYMDMVAFSELNMHYVQSHFMHPDDVLDPDRGAEDGWEKLSQNFEKYLKYIYTSAPNIRNCSGSEMAEAVKRFYNVSIDTEYTKDEITMKLGGFLDECYFICRFNDGVYTDIEGGTIEHLTGNLYLIHATSDNVVIKRGEK